MRREDYERQTPEPIIRRNENESFLPLDSIQVGMIDRDGAIGAAVMVEAAGAPYRLAWIFSTAEDADRFIRELIGTRNRIWPGK